MTSTTDLTEPLYGPGSPSIDDLNAGDTAWALEPELLDDAAGDLAKTPGYTRLRSAFAAALAEANR